MRYVVIVLAVLVLIAFALIWWLANWCGHLSQVVYELLSHVNSGNRDMAQRPGNGIGPRIRRL